MRIINLPGKESKKNFSSAAIASDVTTLNLEYSASCLYPLTSLSNLKRKILRHMYEDLLCGIVWSDRSIFEWARIYSVHHTHIARVFGQLRDEGYTHTQRKRRLRALRSLSPACAYLHELSITNDEIDRFYPSDFSMTTQSANQESSHTNIDLFSRYEEKEYINNDIILKDIKLGNYADIVDEKGLEHALDEFFEDKLLDHEESNRVKDAFKRSALPTREKINVFRSVVLASLKRPIQRFLYYFKACLRNARNTFKTKGEIAMKLMNKNIFWGVYKKYACQ